VTPHRRADELGQASPGERGSVQLRLDPNTAFTESLGALPGVAPGLAAKIVDVRESAPFDSAENFDQRVAGNGPSQTERVRPHLRFPDDLAGRDPAWNDVLAGQPSHILAPLATPPGISVTDMALERAARVGEGGEPLRADSARGGLSRSDFSEMLRDLSEAWREAIPPMAATSIPSSDQTSASIAVSKGVEQATDEAILALQRLTRAAGAATATMDSSRAPAVPPPLPSGRPFEDRYS